ncbi:hypothetical protein GCM10023196_035810 [Actinoallomurus vinaceus]|uniref:Uncharacterized protein n=1 Tax=Actinoallomurus vinaceus TaxID=1080074 RepID=A0ABP8UCP7_9ACTN
MSTSIFTGDFGELRVETEMIDVTSSLPKPDPNWTYTDENGHEHRYEDGYPTLVRVVDDRYIDEFGDEMEEAHLECRQCGEHQAGQGRPVAVPRVRPRPHGLLPERRTDQRGTLPRDRCAVRRAERMSEQPRQMQDLERAFAQAGREIGKALGEFSFVTRAQGAMGFMVQGNAERAREALDGFTPEQRARVAEAARNLAELADE